MSAVRRPAGGRTTNGTWSLSSPAAARRRTTPLGRSAGISSAQRRLPAGVVEVVGVEVHGRVLVRRVPEVGRVVVPVAAGDGQHRRVDEAGSAEVPDAVRRCVAGELVARQRPRRGRTAPRASRRRSARRRSWRRHGSRRSRRRSARPAATTAPSTARRSSRLAEHRREAGPALRAKRRRAQHLDGAAAEAGPPVGCARTASRRRARAPPGSRPAAGSRRPYPDAERPRRRVVLDHRVGAAADLLHAARIAAVDRARHGRAPEAGAGRVRVAVPEPHQPRRRTPARSSTPSARTCSPALRAPAVDVADQLAAGVVDDPRHSVSGSACFGAGTSSAGFRSKNPTGLRWKPGPLDRHHGPVLGARDVVRCRTRTRARRRCRRWRGRRPSTPAGRRRRGAGTGSRPPGSARRRRTASPTGGGT